MITFLVTSWIITVFAVAGAILYAESAHHEKKEMKANITALQNRLMLEVQANTRLEIENARLLVEAKELRAMAVQEIDKELVAKVRAVAA